MVGRGDGDEHMVVRLTSFFSVFSYMYTFLPKHVPEELPQICNHIDHLKYKTDISSQDVLDTPDYTVRRAHSKAASSQTNMSMQDTEEQNTTDNSVAGDGAIDGRKKRWEGNALRKSVLGKKHDTLGQSKARPTASTIYQLILTPTTGR